VPVRLIGMSQTGNTVWKNEKGRDERGRKDEPYLARVRF